MRPAKDLKDMVARSRGGIFSDDPEDSALDTSISNKHLNNQSFVQAGRASMGGAPPSGSFNSSFMSTYRGPTVAAEETAGTVHY